MKLLLALLFNLIIVHQIAGQTKIDVFRPLNRPDFEEIYTGGTFTIKGKISLVDRDFLEFYITNLDRSQETLAIQCESDGSFEETFPIIGGQTLFFNHGERYSFYIQSGDTLELYQPAQNALIQIVQKDAQHMRDMEYKIMQYNNQYGKEANNILAPKGKEVNHKFIVENFFNDLVQYIYSVNDSTVYHPRIDQLIDEEYWRLNLLLIAAQESIGFIEYSDETSRMFEEKYSYSAGEVPAIKQPKPLTFSQKKGNLAPIYDDKYITSANYRLFLEVLVDHGVWTSTPISLSYRAGSAGSLMQALYRVVGQYGYSGLISENMVYSYIVNRSKYYYTDDMLNALGFAKEYIRSPFLKSKLIEFESFYKTLGKGMPAPDFEFEDRDGNVVRLSDLKGKVIYLDFWGVYCGPCLYENEIAPEIYTHYEAQDVLFVNVCIDVDRSKWKEQLKEKRPNVIDLYAEGKTRNEYVRAYNISGIPHYFIIDREGKIQNNSAPRPSSLKRNFESNELSRLIR